MTFKPFKKKKERVILVLITRRKYTFFIDVSWTYCSCHCTRYVNQVTTLNTLNLHSNECHFSIRVQKKKTTKTNQESGDKEKKKGLVVNQGEQRGKPTNTVYATHTNGEKGRHSCWFTLRATGTRWIPSNSLFYCHLFPLLFSLFLTFPTLTTYSSSWIFLDNLKVL